MTKTPSHHEEAARGISAANDDLRPKEVVLSACQEIAAQLAADGFTFAKSQRKLTRTQGDLTFTIWFQSSRHNFSGGRAIVWIHAGVTSKKLAQAKRAHPMPWGDDDGPGGGAVTGGQIGNLLEEPTWMQWDFANPETRQNEIDRALAAIRTIALPFFSLFDEPAGAVELLIYRPWLWPRSLIQYANAAISREAVEAAGEAFLKDHPSVRGPFDDAMKRARSGGSPPEKVANSQRPGSYRASKWPLVRLPCLADMSASHPKLVVSAGQ